MIEAPSSRRSWRWLAYTVAALLVVAALLWATPYWLKGFIEDTVSNRTGRQLRIGALDIDWSLEPELIAQDVRFANADWAERDQMFRAKHLAVRIAVLPLLRGDVVIPAVELRHAALFLQKTGDQGANWALGDRAQQEKSSYHVPRIDRLAISDTVVRYVEPDRDTDLKIMLQADPDVASRGALTGQGEGRYRGEAFTLRFEGGPPLHLLTPDDPYELEMRVAVADTTASLVGQIRNPRAIKASDLDLRLKLRGPDPARLYHLVDLPLPSLPPYAIEGKLVREGTTWKLQAFDGTVGDSDLHGDIALDLGADRPMLNAKLHSNSLDFDDLGTLVGGTPDATETASAQQKQAHRANAGQALPDKPIDLTKVRRIDAAVRFQGKQVRAGKLPVDEVDIDFRLDHGKMHFRPLEFRAGGGKVDARIDIDATGDLLDARLDGEFSRLDLRRLLADVALADDSVGKIGGRAKLWMKGDSVASLLGHADGGLYLIMTGGRLDRVMVELAGLDIGEAVMAKLGEGRQSIPIECSYADLEADDGVLKLSKVVIDSTDTLFTASGTVNLRTEALDVELNPHPKDVSLFAARSKLHIGGSMADPTVRPGTATLLKGGATAVLAAVAGPAAALLPLVETGGGKDSANCASFTKSVDAESVGAGDNREQQP